MKLTNKVPEGDELKKPVAIKPTEAASGSLFGPKSVEKV